MYNTIMNNYKTFQELNLLPEILKSIADKGYTEPTPIQQQVIPQVFNKKDIIAISQTGTGKTASFTLPLLNRLIEDRRLRKGGIRALILVPTRELAVQVGNSATVYGKYLNIKSVTVLGGVNINPQMVKLKGGADILIATPGRLLDLYSKNALKLNNLEFLILDEADKLLDLGFKDELEDIFKLLPSKRETLLFSATFSDEVRLLSQKFLNNPIDIKIDEEITATTIEEWLYPVDKGRKNQLLLKLLKENSWDRLLVFVKSQNRADRLLRFLENNSIEADVIHGKKTQFARTNSLEKLKQGKIRVLVATDLASRGIDISGLPAVINYDLPQVSENYVHRIGRTGRAGMSGLAISFASDDEFDDLVKIESKIQAHIARRVIEGFEMSEPLKSSPPIKPIKIKRPKKKKLKTDDC